MKSPADFPGMGMSLAVSGLSSRMDIAAMSINTDRNCSMEVSPGRGMVSRPVPQWVE
ncbi:MAG TPA: hypothetical protein PKG92_05920 [Anaerolineaceae bacterium]|nr:hypothetical protein [Anaerolineaceae bacterium]